MATTAMDYENANGDRFDGESRIFLRISSACSDTRLLSPHAVALSPIHLSTTPRNINTDTFIHRGGASLRA